MDVNALAALVARGLMPELVEKGRHLVADQAKAMGVPVSDISWRDVEVGIGAGITVLMQWLTEQDMVKDLVIKP